MRSFNRAMYIVTRIGVRPLLGRTRRDTLMHRFWPDSYDFPRPILDLIPLHVRRRWSEDLCIKGMSGQFEHAAMDFMGRVHGRLFVDVGANFGVYCIKLQDNFDRIIAIEADPAIYARLKETCPTNCEAINVVVSNVEGVVSFYAVKDLALNLGLGSLFPGEQQWTHKGKTDKELKLLAAPLSKILKNEPGADLVKVDVEGAEWLVLEGAEAIMPRIKRWVIELHEPARKDELENRMKCYGYDQCSWLDSGGPIHGAFERKLVRRTN